MGGNGTTNGENGDDAKPLSLAELHKITVQVRKEMAVYGISVAALLVFAFAAMTWVTEKSVVPEFRERLRVAAEQAEADAKSVNSILVEMRNTISGGPRIKVVPAQKTFPVPSDTNENPTTAIAPCPDELPYIIGGGYVQANGFVIAVHDFPYGNVWAVRAKTVPPTKEVPEPKDALTVYAVCSNIGPG